MPPNLPPPNIPKKILSIPDSTYKGLRVLVACGTLNQSSSRTCHFCATSCVLHLHPMHRCCAEIGTDCCLTRHSVCVYLQAVQMQAYLLRMLGSGGALYELYSSVCLEPDCTAEEIVDYTVYREGADLVPDFCDGSDTLCKPPLNPAQFLGVSFDASCQQVSLCLVLACKLSSSWTVAWQHFKTKTREEGRKGKERKSTPVYFADVNVT